MKLQILGFEAIRQLPGLPDDLLLVPLPGHSRGHTAVAVRAQPATGSGPQWLLHAGDAYFFHGEIDPAHPRTPPGLRLFQTVLQTDGIDDLLQRFPDVRCEMDAGYRGLHRDHPGQVSVPPKKPAKDAAPELTQAWEQARHAQSSTRICVEHAIADSKNWRSLQRWTGRREYLPETIQAIGSLVSDRAAAR